MENSPVIVVDDNPRNLRAITSILTRYGVSTLACSTFQQADIALEADVPAGLVADYVLDRGHTGLDLAVNARRRFGTAIVIALTTGYDPSVVEGSKNTLDYFLAKPLVRQTIESFVMALTIKRYSLRNGVRDAVLSLGQKFALSVQETRVLACLAAGSTRSRLASDIGISENTMKSQIRTLLVKTSASDTCELSSMLLREINCSAPEHC